MKIALRVVAVTAAAALALTACGSSERTTTSTTTTAASGGSSSGSAPAAGGFDKGASIGVALPAKTSENWVLAGGLFTDGLTAAGYKADVQYAASTGTVADQQNEITTMVTNGAKVIIIGAEDGAQLGAQVKAAKEAGATVIAYDRLILNTDSVDYYVAYDNFKVGQLQGQALLDGMKAKKATGPYNIELFAGAATDANATVFFNGAMDVLQPKIDDGTLKVVSGQTKFDQVSTEGWLAQKAQSRMDTLLSANYTSTELDGVLSPNDTLARAIITSVKAAGKTIPIVTGQDSEAESVKSIMAGEQYSTINKDTRALVAQAIKMVGELQAGSTVDVNDTKSYNNGNKIVPTFLLPPLLVTKANAAEAYANDPTLGPLTK